MEIICPECKWTLANVIKGRLYLTEHSRLLESQHDRDYHFQCRGCGATRWHKTKDYSELAETQEKLRLARQQVDKLLEQVVDLEEKNRWIPVSEKLPERTNGSLGERYLVLYGDYYAEVCVYAPADRKWFREGVEKTKYVTHWKPILAPLGGEA